MSESEAKFSSPPRPIRVLIVDDSAFVRKVVREIISAREKMEVIGAARDGAEALRLTEELRPDIVVCDLIMPTMNGAEFVRRQMARRPVPILILSAAAEDAAEVIDALSAGAIDIVQKPSALATDDLKTVGAELIEKLYVGITAHLENLKQEIPSTPLTAGNARRDAKVEIVVIGISTGGPQALRRMLPLFPADFPVPIALVLHMPVGYTALFAAKLNEACAIEVKEAREGDLVLAGRALLAPAGKHLGFRRTATGAVVVQLLHQPIDKIHRPSVDVLFRSAATVYDKRVLAVVMTGMGEDGKEGAAWVKARGGTVLTEAEKSCVIYGMPRSIVEAGLSDLQVPLEDMAEAIISHL